MVCVWDSGNDICCSVSVSENQVVLPVLKEKKMVHWATFINSQSSHMYMFLLQITILDQHDHITNSGFWNKNSLLFTCTERKGSLLVLVGAYPHSLKGLHGRLPNGNRSYIEKPKGVKLPQ